MSDYEFLARLYVINEQLTRQTGKTTALIKATKKVKGIFIAYNVAQRNQLKIDYPDVDIRIPSMLSLRGATKPIIFDHYLLDIILRNSMLSYTCKHMLTENLEGLLKTIQNELISRMVIKIE